MYLMTDDHDQIIMSDVFALALSHSALLLFSMLDDDDDDE